MRVSLYGIYSVACTLVCVVAILGGIVLVNTYDRQQSDSEATQLKAGMGQVTAFQTIIGNQMKRMQTASDANARTFFLQTSSLPDEAYAPDEVLNSLNDTIYRSWVPLVKAVNQLNGFGLTLMYTNQTSGQHYDRTFQVYWDMQMTGNFEYAFAVTSLEDGLCYAWRTVWPNYSTPVLVQDMYAFDAYSVMAQTYMEDDFYDFAQPWSASDGNSYWYFTHMRAFYQHGVWINLQTWDVAVSWLDMMRSVLTEDARFVAFDSLRRVMAATNPDEVRRLANCRGAYVSGAIPANCISSPADEHPTAEIRAVFAALHAPPWDDLAAGPIAPQMATLFLQGKKYMAISGTLFSKNNFRTIIVWYQPWVTPKDDAATLTALICLLTVSTFVLTLLSIFGVLRPLTTLGRAMRAVAQMLKEGDGEAGRVLEPRKPNVFVEVDEIGKDFETIMVDFLGFSSDNARDNRYAPKDTDKPFAVLFTDIQSSTGLWGVDPAEMSRCLQAHHDLLRGLVRKHRLYEVKTVGDSFMVTTSSAHEALLFALDVQTTLFDYDWGWAGADEFYRETTLVFAKAVPGPAMGTEYSELWNGLRVRVGIHYGRGEVTYDEVSKGYDYYGPVVNAAARIESLAHGGQVVVSQEVLDATPSPLDPLSKHHRTIGIVTSLGVFPLRGVAQPPALLEVKPTRLQHRTFPPLRVHAEQNAEMVAIPVDQVMAPQHRPPSVSTKSRGHSSSYSHSSPSPSPSPSPAVPLHRVAEELAHSHTMVRTGVFPLELVTQQLLTLYRLVEDLLKPLAPAQHTTVMKALAKGWGVPVPQTRTDFVGSALRVVHRMSETTKALSYMIQRLDLEEPTPRFVEAESV